MAKGTQGGSPEQHAKGGSHNSKNDGKQAASDSKSSSGRQGGTPKQQAKAGSQSHKNDR